MREKTFKITLGELRSIIRETILEEGGSALNESEIYVDEHGWAVDDEGNRWYHGKGGRGEVYKASAYQSRYGAGPKAYAPKKIWTPEQAGRLVSVLDRIISAGAGGDFLRSVRDQVSSRSSLTTKQLAVVQRIVKGAGMLDSVKDIIG